MEEVRYLQGFAICIFGVVQMVSSDKSIELDLMRCLKVSVEDLQALNTIS